MFSTKEQSRRHPQLDWSSSTCKHGRGSTAKVNVQFLGPATRDPAIRARAAKAKFVRDTILERFVFAALCVNGRSSRRVATPSSWPLQHNPCCERMQRGICWSPVGSPDNFTALFLKVRSQLQMLGQKPAKT